MYVIGSGIVKKQSKKPISGIAAAMGGIGMCLQFGRGSDRLMLLRLAKCWAGLTMACRKL